jgi:hypothetical protein
VELAESADHLVDSVARLGAIEQCDSSPDGIDFTLKLLVHRRIDCAGSWCGILSRSEDVVILLSGVITENGDHLTEQLAQCDTLACVIEVGMAERERDLPKGVADAEVRGLKRSNAIHEALLAVRTRGPLLMNWT